MASSILETKIFAVADPPGLRGATDRLDRFLDHVVAEHNLDLHLGEKIHDVFGAAIKLGMPFLPAKALGFGNGDALQSDFLQCLFHLVELEWLDNGLDLLHRVSFRRRLRVRHARSAALRLAGSMPSPREREKRLMIRDLHRDCDALRRPERPPDDNLSNLPIL